MEILNDIYDLPETRDVLWESIFMEHLDVLKMKIRKYPDNYIFEFEDYTADELYQIFELKLHNAGLTISEGAKETLFKVVKFGAGRRNFGNGRYVDKLLQRALTKHALLDLPTKDMLVLQKESIPTVEEIMKSFGRFSA